MGWLTFTPGKFDQKAMPDPGPRSGWRKSGAKDRPSRGKADVSKVRWSATLRRFVLESPTINHALTDRAAQPRLAAI